jgi:hypothetical protein
LLRDSADYLKSVSDFLPAVEGGTQSKFFGIGLEYKSHNINKSLAVKESIDFCALVDSSGNVSLSFGSNVFN